MIKLYSAANAPEELIDITLCEGKAPAPFSEDAKFSPDAHGGFLIYVDTAAFKWYQQAARTVASLGVYALNLKSDVALSKTQLYWFVTALYDGRHDIKLAFNLDEKELLEIESKSNLISEFRTVADTDSKLSTPLKLVNALYEKIQKCAGECNARTSLEIIGRGDEKFSQCIGLNTVGLASDESPCMGIIDVVPQGVKKDSPVDIALVGKGITFDTGGYSLKPEKFMETMRTDKTGVVYLCGAVALALRDGLKKHVRLYLCCSENMVSGRGMLPGDIIKYPNGVSVEINNTDAEGRLVLADGLLKASEDKALFILDMATLTGAAKVAVGRDMFSILTRGNVLDTGLKDALERNDEVFWQLPLYDFHRRFLSSRRADVTNSGHGDGAPGASVAASFLEQFADKNTPWVHIDLSSAYLPEGSPFLAAGPSGSTILGLASWLCD